MIPGALVTIDTEKKSSYCPYIEWQHHEFQGMKIWYVLPWHWKIANNNKITVTNYSEAHYSLLDTLENKKDIYTQQEIEGADRERKLKKQMVWPGLDTFKFYIDNSLIQNCDINIDNSNKAHQIYGTSIPILKGKTNKQFSTENHETTSPLPLHTS